MSRRLSTYAFGRSAAALLDTGPKLLEALDLPMIVDPLATMDAHDQARFFLLAPFQTFKSLVGQLRLLRNHRVRPRPALWYAPTGDFAKDFADLKLNPLIDALPDLVALHFDTGIRGSLDRNRASKSSRRLTGGASHLLLSAGTERDRHGKTACDLYLDEVHLYEPGAIAQISNRRGAYPDEFTETYMSTGLTGGTEAAELWRDTDQRTWHCRCPACERLFEPRFAHYGPPDPTAAGKPAIIGGLRYTRAFRADGHPDEAVIAASLVYECPHCHATYPDTHGTRVAFSGTAAAPRGLYVATAPSPAARTFGWTFTGIATRPWLPIVKRFELAHLARSRGDLEELGKWVREEMAGIWIAHEHVREQKLRPTGGYKLGDPWPGEDSDPDGHPYRIATVDVQQDWFRLVIRAWNRRSQSRLIWADTVTTPGRIKDLCDAHRVLPSRTVLDRRHKPSVVRMLCAQFGWRSLQGETDRDYLHPDGIRRIISQPAYIDPFLGTAHQGHAIVVENNFAKWTALDRLDLLRRLTTNAGEPLFSAADDSPEWYFKELDAYSRIPKFKNGEEFWEWQAHGPDHSADCEIMGIAVASALSLTGSESLTPAPTTPEPSQT